LPVFAAARRADPFDLGDALANWERRLGSDRSAVDELNV
jgi:hypothetical protein